MYSKIKLKHTVIGVAIFIAIILFMIYFPAKRETISCDKSYKEGFDHGVEMMADTMIQLFDAQSKSDSTVTDLTIVGEKDTIRVWLSKKIFK